MDRRPLQMQVGHVMNLAKIVIREFYDKNRHLFPYKDWITYDDYLSSKRSADGEKDQDSREESEEEDDKL